ncbi:MAG TPA: hypothetical protein VK163_06460 [Opitutaceae bacterium]|nr:hypothetical protein [Opitutaceae bacterium]
MAAEFYDLTFQRGRRPEFDAAPARHRRRVHGVDYLAVRGMQGGDLYVTREGWAVAESLLPAVWYDDQRFRTLGRALPGATGSVYRVPAPHPVRRDMGLVVKFCRFGQDVGLTVLGDAAGFPWPAALLGDAQFLGPFEEFAAIARLRARVVAGHGPVVRTKRPLAIYSPATRHPLWELGRADHLYARQAGTLAADQRGQPEQPPVAYDPERLYVLIYQWVEGIDAEEAARVGVLGNDAMIALSHASACDVAAHGFAVLDHKPRHIIVRPARAGGLLSRRGRTVYAIIDYELLVPLPGFVARAETAIRLSA